MDLIVSLFTVAGGLMLLKYFGKAALVAIAALLTPFVALYQLVAGKASNRRHAAIIAISGLVVFACSATFALLINHS